MSEKKTADDIIPRASFAKTWVNCTAAISAIKANAHRLKLDKSSTWADEGKGAHELAEKILRTCLLTPTYHPSMKEISRKFIKYDTEYAELHHYVDHCLALMDSTTAGNIFIESIVPLWYDPSLQGTVDFARVSEDAIVIRDLKWGKGVFVSPERNYQLCIYAYSLAQDLINKGLYSFNDDTVVSLGIIQPRYVGDDPVKIWDTTYSELKSICADIYTAAEIVLTDDKSRMEFNPSRGTCQFCHNRPICDARIKHALTAVPEMVGKNMLAGLPEGELDAIKHSSIDFISITDQEIVNMYKATGALLALVDDIRVYVHDRTLVLKKPFVGLKVVRGRESIRRWKDDADIEKEGRGGYVESHIGQYSELEKTLGPKVGGEENLYKRVLMGPVQALTALKKGGVVKPKEADALLVSLTKRARGKLTIVPDSDPRPGESLIELKVETEDCNAYTSLPEAD